MIFMVGQYSEDPEDNWVLDSEVTRYICFVRIALGAGRNCQKLRLLFLEIAHKLEIMVLVLYIWD
jgi:hypothetical protein